ncbi:DUF4352 domain-containing protein [Paenibacillus brevis]|uniref:DUF4352 domain-containing protein n=1 Tax=Paenibacillus brevis TaxID=2841508 RepID=A0ABS6FQX1_9BACL|nr:DUF4352 domain-containing protein [Paenibacillus brevis]MBU5672593.1 DUF4352 domain-containing protein [Paenibacillus brevis]
MEKAKKKWYKQWWIWFIIVVIIGAIGANLNSSDKAATNNQVNEADDKAVGAEPTDKPEEGVDQAEPGEPAAKDDDNVITAAGQTIQTKNFKITVEQFEKVESDNEFLQPEEGNEFLSIGLLIENISEKDYIVSSAVMFSAYQDGFSINEDLSVHVLKGGDTTLNGDLAAGKKMKGNLTYQVPSDWEELEVQVDLTALSFFNDDGKVKILLQNQ